MRNTLLLPSLLVMLLAVGWCASEACAQGLPPANGVGPQAKSESAESLRGEVRAALQASMRIGRDNRTDVVERLIDLDGRLADTAEVSKRDRQRLQTQVRNRLAQLSGVIQRQLALEAEQRGDVRQPADVRLPPRPAQVLAQRLFGPPPGGFGPGRPVLRGAGMVPLRPLAAGPPDNGPALVELIQRTIEPGSWDVNGGPGAIVYFAPSRVLVVRNRSEVHEQLHDVVRHLRP